LQIERARQGRPSEERLELAGAWIYADCRRYDAPGMAHRQQVLILYLANSALDSRVVSWAMYDGTGQHEHLPGGSNEPPYESGLAALRAGWRLIQMSQLNPPAPGREFTVSYQRYEFLFEKWEPFFEGDPAPGPG
jgi:hypothetical protein